MQPYGSFLVDWKNLVGSHKNCQRGTGWYISDDQHSATRQLTPDAIIAHSATLRSIDAIAQDVRASLASVVGQETQHSYMNRDRPQVPISMSEEEEEDEQQQQQQLYNEAMPTTTTTRVYRPPPSVSSFAPRTQTGGPSPSAPQLTGRIAGGNETPMQRHRTVNAANRRENNNNNNNNKKDFVVLDTETAPYLYASKVLNVNLEDPEHGFVVFAFLFEENEAKRGVFDYLVRSVVKGCVHVDVHFPGFFNYPCTTFTISQREASKMVLDKKFTRPGRSFLVLEVTRKQFIDAYKAGEKLVGIKYAENFKTQAASTVLWDWTFGLFGGCSTPIPTYDSMGVSGFDADADDETGPKQAVTSLTCTKYAYYILEALKCPEVSQRLKQHNPDSILPIELYNAVLFYPNCIVRDVVNFDQQSDRCMITSTIQ